MKRLTGICVFGIAALTMGIGSVAWTPSAEAGAGLRAKIFLLQKGVPGRLGERGVLKFARANRVKRLAETRDRPIPERMWKATMVAAFNRPIGDLEFELLFYDTQDANKKFIAPTTVFLGNRDDRTIVHKLRLKRPEFKPNRRMQMVVTVRRHEVARHAFQIIGQHVQHSGEVTFSDEETR